MGLQIQNDKSADWPQMRAGRRFYSYIGMLADYSPACSRWKSAIA